MTDTLTSSKVKPSLIIGADLSKAGLALVALPWGWLTDKGPEWKRVVFTTLEPDRSGDDKHWKTRASELEKMQRHISDMDELAVAAVDWIAAVSSSPGVSSFEIWIEGALTRDAYHLVEQGELRGIFRRELFKRTGQPGFIAPQSSARSLFLGKLPKSDRKAAVCSVLEQIGDPFETDDERDALVAGNWGAAQHGLPFFAIPRPPDEPRKPRGKKPTASTGSLALLPLTDSAAPAVDTVVDGAAPK